MTPAEAKKLCIRALHRDMDGYEEGAAALKVWKPESLDAPSGDHKNARTYRELFQADAAELERLEQALKWLEGISE